MALASISPGMIPKKLHHVCVGGTIPSLYRPNVARVANLNPGWRHKVWLDEDVESFILDRYGASMLALYRKINPEYGACRSDFFRYLLMYREGGVYMDLKSHASRPLDEVLRPEDAYILSQWGDDPAEATRRWGLHKDLSHVEGGEYRVWLIICEPGHPFLDAVIQRVSANIERYSPQEFGVGQMGVLRATGPIAYTLAIHPILRLHPHRFVDTHQDLGMDWTFHREKIASFGRHYTELTSPVVAA